MTACNKIETDSQMQKSSQQLSLLGGGHYRGQVLRKTTVYRKIRYKGILYRKGMLPMFYNFKWNIIYKNIILNHYVIHLKLKLISYYKFTIFE